MATQLAPHSDIRSVWEAKTTSKHRAERPTEAGSGDLPRFEVVNRKFTPESGTDELGINWVAVGVARSPTTTTVVTSGLATLLEDIVRNACRPVTAIAAVVLDWERGSPVLQLVVDRASNSSRHEAYKVEQLLSRHLPSISMNFRLLDESDVDFAATTGGKIVFKRR